MNITNTHEEETGTEAQERGQENNPHTMLLVEEHRESRTVTHFAHAETPLCAALAAHDELPQQHYQQTFHLDSIKSYVYINQVPSQGISFKLWPAAMTLVSLLDHNNNTTFSGLFKNPHSQPLRILELGSGTGIVGIAAASILGAHVMLTDLAHVIPNLKFNADANVNTIEINGGNVGVAELSWGEEEEMEAIKRKGEFDILMGSDLVYHDHLYEPLLRTLRFFLLGEGVKNRVFVMAHSKRWKKESVFFKKAKKDFDVEVIHRDDPCNGDRVGILVCTFVANNKNKNMKKVEVEVSE